MPHLCTVYLELRDSDHVEFLSRRVEQFEKTLLVRYRRRTEKRADREALRGIHSDPEQLWMRYRTYGFIMRVHNEERKVQKKNIAGIAYWSRRENLKEGHSKSDLVIA